MPEETTPKESALPAIRQIEWDQPMRWLALAWKDIAQHPFWSLIHGVVIALAGWVITALAHDQFWLLVGAISGFMVVAPILATGLYAISRAHELQEPVNAALIIRTWLTWSPHTAQKPKINGRLVKFGLLLSLAATGWVLTSSALITLLADHPVQTPMDFVHHVVLAPNGLLFEIWLGLGGLMAAPIFASSVVSIPMLVDRQASVMQATMTSWKVVMTHPVILSFWAFLIMGFSLLGVLSLFLGLVFVVPMLGHASWHAYKDLVNDAWPHRFPEGPH
jgi:uncharacterized membrane protein